MGEKTEITDESKVSIPRRKEQPLIEMRRTAKGTSFYGGSKGNQEYFQNILGYNIVYLKYLLPYMTMISILVEQRTRLYHTFNTLIP